MQSANELDTNAVSRLPSSERLPLAALILNMLTKEQTDMQQPSHTVFESLDRQIGARFYKTAVESDEHLQEERVS